jgi:hypothetical protein
VDAKIKSLVKGSLAYGILFIVNVI